MSESDPWIICHIKMTANIRVCLHKSYLGLGIASLMTSADRIHRLCVYEKKIVFSTSLGFLFWLILRQRIMMWWNPIESWQNHVEFTFKGRSDWRAVGACVSEILNCSDYFRRRTQMSTIQILACMNFVCVCQIADDVSFKRGKNCISCFARKFAIHCTAEPDENVNKQTNYSD